MYIVNVKYTQAAMKYLSIILFLLFSFSARADYGYMPLSMVVEECDYSVVGTVVKIDANYFWVKVDKVIYGDVIQDTLPIILFKDWNCGKRYAKYEIGQKEVVFFSKSNDLISEYDYLCTGGGGESELKIRDGKYVQYKYAFSSDRYLEFSLDTFIRAVSEYKNIQKSLVGMKVDGLAFTADFNEFSKRSLVHKYLTKNQRIVKEKDNDDLLDSEFLGRQTSKGGVANMETDYLYEGYNNKVEVLIPNEKFEDLIMVVKDAEVRKYDDYYTINPIGGWSRRWVYIYKRSADGDSITLFAKTFDVYPIPEPSLFLGEELFQDSISLWQIRRGGYLSVKQYLGKRNSNKYLTYTVLKFDVDILSSAGDVRTFRCKNSNGSHELHDAIRKVKVGDVLKYYNIVVAYPDGTVKELPSKKGVVVDND